MNRLGWFAVVALALSVAAVWGEETRASVPLTEEQRSIVEKSAEQFEFQAEVGRLMDIIINSLYSNREIFIRELISNAADAIGKVRHNKLQNKEAVNEDDFYIRVEFDKDAKTLSITDNGIGMTKEELKKNLGIVARSGTTDFVQAAASGADALTLIGQFGVGFYSVYLVADKVTVFSKSDNDTQHVWESAADKTFTVAADPRGNTLGRGTQVVLTLKEDAEELLAEAEIEKLIGRYSQFITFPIYLWTSKTESKEVPIEEEAPAEKATEDIQVTEEDDDAPAKPKTKTVQETTQFWRRINTAKAIWARNPKEVKPEEYEEFYKSITKDNNGYLTKIHFSAEGEISFRSILYVPKTAEYNLYDKFYEKSTALKLYVRKVLISDQFEDFLPRYMNFIKGVVDSDDLPLNVSRETLAQSRVLKVMSKKITRKVLEMLRKLADSEKEDGGKGSEAEEGEEEDDNIQITGVDSYQEFWKQFGKSLKLGVIDDRANRNKLLKLLRYASSKSGEKLISLEQYVERMKDNQKYIYYVTGESQAAVEKSPFLEKLKQRDLEVLYMTDPLDEYVVQQISEFDGNQLMSVTKEGLKLPDDDESSLAAQKEEYKPLCDWLQSVYGKKVEKVVVSSRIASSPAVLVTAQYGWSANMERIMKAQTFADADKYSHMAAKKTMEINPNHPIIQELKNKSASAGEDQMLRDLATLIYDAALLNSGFTMDAPEDFAARIHRVVSLGLNIDPAAAPAAAEPAAGAGHDEL